jgi:hypothetical protein
MRSIIAASLVRPAVVGSKVGLVVKIAPWLLMPPTGSTVRGLFVLVGFGLSFGKALGPVRALGKRQAPSDKGSSKRRALVAGGVEKRMCERSERRSCRRKKWAETLDATGAGAYQDR